MIGCSLSGSAAGVQPPLRVSDMISVLAASKCTYGVKNLVNYYTHTGPDLDAAIASCGQRLP
jgi:hypothetical protein